MQGQSNQAPKKTFRHSIENFRGLAILFVVLTHISSLDEFGLLGKYLRFLLEDATTFFVFISGYLFNYTEQRRFEYPTYLWKKAKFVILPYLCLSIVAIGVGLFYNRHQLLDLMPVTYILWSLIVGGAVVAPMWFIPMIVLFFIVSPLFHKLGTSRGQYAVAFVTLAVSMFTSRSVGNLNPLLGMVHFLGFYVLGIVMAANARQIDAFEKTRSASMLMIVTLLLTMFSAIRYCTLNKLEPIGFWDGLGAFNLVQFGKFSMLICVFLVLGRFMNTPNRLLGWLAEISFGLFFIHGFFILLFAKLAQKFTFHAPIEKLGVELGLIVGGAMLAVTGIRYVLGKWSRYVIGC